MISFMPVQCYFGELSLRNGYAAASPVSDIWNVGCLREFFAEVTFQAKLTSAPSNAPPEPKVRGGRRRIFVCDDEDDSDDAVCAGDEIPFKKEVPETRGWPVYFQLRDQASFGCFQCV